MRTEPKSSRQSAAICRKAIGKHYSLKMGLKLEYLEHRRLLAFDSFTDIDNTLVRFERDNIPVFTTNFVNLSTGSIVQSNLRGGVNLPNPFTRPSNSQAGSVEISWKPELAESHLNTVKQRVAGNENYKVDADGNVQAINPYLDSESSSRDSNSITRMSGPADSPPFPLEQTFFLHSRPTATKTIYLDFTGHTTTGTSWNTSTGVSPIITPAYTLDGNPDFSSSELEQIQRIWERVAEDFIPFDVNVTTQEPPINDLRNTGGSDTRWGIRVVIGANTGWYANVGGVAYLNSFNWSSDTPTFVFNTSEKSVAEAISHEVGHTLGLSHDGASSTSYYQGHGSGATGWAPIMGVGYYRDLVQWSKGEYPGANNTQNDLSIITNINGFGYRPDDHGNSLAGATQVVVSGTSVFADGIIERTSDLDFFKFTTTGGVTQLNITPFYRSPNLDILATLYNSTGSVIATSNPVASLSASFSLTLAAGTYYLSVDGTGKDVSGTDYGYSDYASLGYFSISGNVPNVNATIDQAFVYHKGSSFASGGIENALDLGKSLASEGSSPITLNYNNLINSSRGINGLVFDIQHLAAPTLTASDFQFQYSPTGVFLESAHPPASWLPAPNPSSIAVTSGSTSRVVLEWPDSAIANRWLRITIKANSNTGLASPSVYYIGHLTGETTGPVEGVYTVSFADITPIRNAVGQTVNASDIHDIDKNGTVSFLDISSMRDHVGIQLTNITIPMSGGGGGGSSGELITSGSTWPSTTLRDNVGTLAAFNGGLIFDGSTIRSNLLEILPSFESINKLPDRSSVHLLNQMSFVKSVLAPAESDSTSPTDELEKQAEATNSQANEFRLDFVDLFFEHLAEQSWLTGLKRTR